MLSSLKNFINDIEEHIYKTELVYRSLLVVASDKEGLLLKKELENRDYCVLLIDSRYDISSVVDYNKISHRIVIVCAGDKFNEFINHLEFTDLTQSSFNFIGFSYNIEANVINDMQYFYIVDKTDNNKYNTIIFDKNYKNLMYLESIRK